MKTALVTGGAGFIGSHVADALLRAGLDKVKVYDNFRSGQRLYTDALRGNPAYELIEADVLDLSALKTAMEGVDAVFHFQANADVRGGIENRRIDLEQNTIATWNALEAAAHAKAKHFVFASSATVFGEPDVFPTPETYPSIQTSLYGASKLAGEAMIQAYCEYTGMRGSMFRFVSWVGPRYSHGVIFDFFKKLRKNPTKLQILGNGKQRKSYLDVRDGVRAILSAVELHDQKSTVFNVGHDDFIPVTEVAAIICEEMGLDKVEYEFTGGDRGWIGDSPIVHLDTSRLKSLGWKPEIPIQDSVRDTIRFLIQNEASIVRD